MRDGGWSSKVPKSPTHSSRQIIPPDIDASRYRLRFSAMTLHPLSSTHGEIERVAVARELLLTAIWALALTGVAFTCWLYAS